MELTEHLSAKYGYELESYVEEYKTTLEYQEKLGPSLNSDGEVIIRRSPEEIESPCTRYNSFLLVRKNNKLDFIKFDYFEIELENGNTIYISDKPEVIISGIDECLGWNNLKNEDWVKDVLFSKGNNIIGYNFVTNKTFSFDGIGKCIRAEDNELILLRDGELVTYRVVEEDEGVDVVDTTRIVRQDTFYEDKKEITRCTPVDIEVKKGDKFYYSTESMHCSISVYKLDFKDKTTRLLILDRQDNIITTDYYNSIRLRKPYIYPPLEDGLSRYMRNEHAWADKGLTFNYTKNGESGEMLIDEDLDIHHRKRILNLSDRG
jgi:hypothetical protein